MVDKIHLKQAERFHGHLGPYLVLGILAGELALKRLNCRKYFGLEVKVWGADKKPKSCLIDGLQLSTGATYGKGNIHKLNGNVIRIEFSSSDNHKKVVITFKDSLIRQLNRAKTHSDSESLAKKLYEAPYGNLFLTK